jgi:predicted DNA-binding WGR domain protein
MHSFEFVEGTSAKFWEVDRDGVEVTVRWGRVGTSGQTKSKTFADESQAQAHELKLITEKTRKGYAEVSAPTAAAAAPASSSTPASETTPPPAAPPAPASAPTPPPTSAPTDEDSFIVPTAWYRHRYPRRTSPGLGRFTPDAKARAVVDEEIKRVPHQARKLLEAKGTDPDIRKAGLAWLDGAADAPPIGAAAVAIAATLGRWNEEGRATAFADLWIADRGLLFAVEAAATIMGLRVTDALSSTTSARQEFMIRRLQPGEDRPSWHQDPQLIIALRVRQALAAASDDDYASAVALLAGFRNAHLYHRAATSLLAPDQTAWVEQDIAAADAADDDYLALALLPAAGTGEQAATLAALANTWSAIGSLAQPVTLAEGVGPASAPALFHWFDDDRGADAQRRLLTVLAALPGDEVMTGLIARADQKYVVPALLEAVERFPRRGLRLLAEAADQRTIADLLRAHVLAHLDLVEAVRPDLSPAAAARVDAIAGDAATTVLAPAEAVPELLASPPWHHRKKAAKPVVIPGLTCADPATVAWLPGERENWSQNRDAAHGGNDDDWASVAKRIVMGRASWYEPIRFFSEAPVMIARPVLTHWRPRETYDSGNWMRVIAARFELDALPAMLDLAQRGSEIAPVFLPFSAPVIAVRMADWLTRLKSVRRLAITWLLRHPAEAARALVPPALDKAGPARRAAERALLVLHTNGHTEAVRAAAASYGPAPAAAVETLLTTDPLDVLPAKLPPVPAWAVPGLLPPVTLRGNAGALPADAVTNLITVLALSKVDEPYAGVEIVKQACDPSGLAEFAWAMFQRWQSSGANPKENWVLDALGLIGDDETVRRLTPLILAWPGEGGHAKAVTGVNVLAAVGSDVALMHLHGIAQRAKFKGLKTAANQKMDEVAAALGLSAEQLADRLVPDFGLDTDGSMRLDYGPRQFVVGFDEQLRPYVTDAAGKHLKALPKPGARDDAERGEAAYKQFAGLKKDVRTIAGDQIRRLERAMVTGRRWSGVEFRQLFVGHPLMWHIVRRLVWGLYDTGGALTGAIRVAEDRSFSNADDDTTTIADDALVGVAHPLHLTGELATWSELFADYEILQPFPQLSRETFALTPEEAAGAHFAKFEGVTLPTTKLMGLERRGWRRESPQDAGIQAAMELVLAPNLEVAVELDPGIIVGMPTEFAEQKLTHIYVHDGTAYSSWSRGNKGLIPLGKLDPVAASEIIRDLTDITA